MGKAYGGLQHAADYGVDTYKGLSKSLKGTGLQAHHIVEKRLVNAIGIADHKLMKSVAVTKAEHQAFTNPWRQVIPFGTDYSTLSKDYIWEAAQEIYKDAPELMKAAQETVFN
jgi:hypothetical protein